MQFTGRLFRNYMQQVVSAAKTTDSLDLSKNSGIMYSSKKVIIQLCMFVLLSNITNYCTTLQSITNAKYSANVLFISCLAHQSISYKWSLRIKCSIPPHYQFNGRKDELHKQIYSQCLFSKNLPSRLKH